MLSILCIFFCLICFDPTHALDSLILPDAVLVTSTCDERVPSFQLALRDIHQDWYGVLGKPPVKRNQIPNPASLKHYTSTVVVFLGSRQCLSNSFPQFSTLPKLETEQHVCQLLSYNQTGLFFPLVCYGEDSLGTVYATYALSHNVLGIDPQAFWIEKKPVLVSRISVPSQFHYDSGVPTWKNRGFFINDEDQLGGWAMDPLGQKVFTLQMWDIVFQTVLRLRGNTIIVGTSAYPDEQSFDLAVRRGLSLSQHHVTILGTAMFAWPDGLPYDYPFNPEVVVENWRRNVAFELSKGRKVLWTLGYRGKNDYAFWNDIPSFNTSQSRGNLISEAVLTQKKIIDELGGPDQEKFGYLWAELLDLYTGGYLKFPSDVHVVHTDNGAGQVYHQELVEEGHGVYYHNAMMSNHQNQLTELLSPSRLFEQLKTFVQKLALAYFILNTSDLRAVPLSTKVCMDFAWNSQQFLNLTPTEAQEMFISGWVEKVYSLPADSPLIAQLTHLYDAYFDVPYMAGTSGNSMPLGEHHLATTARQNAQAITNWVTSKGKKSLPVSNAKSEISLVSSSIPELINIITSAEPIQSQLPQERQQFFNNHLLVQLQIHIHGAYADFLVADAIVSLASNSNSTAITYLQEAIDHIDQLIAAEKTAEGGLWQNWYMWDQLVDWISLRDVVLTAFLSVSGENQIENLPPIRGHSDGTGPWSQEFQYEYNSQTYFPLFYESDYFMDGAVTVTCAKTASTCTLTPIGIDFTGPETYIVLGALRQQSSIRYTIDGSNPTIKSPEWNGQPIRITSSWATGNVTFNAAAFSNGTSAGPVTKAVCVAKRSVL